MPIGSPASAYQRLPASCPDCLGQGVIGYDVEPGHPMFGKVKQCPNEQYHGADRLQRMAKISGLLPSDLKRRLSDIKPTPGGENAAMIEAARNMIDDPFGWLYIHGGPGNAKSEVLIAIVNELNASGKGPAVYLKFSELINWMRDSFTEQSNRQKQLSQGKSLADLENLGFLDRFNRIKSVRVLAIDELDKARMTDFAQEFRFDFLDERYRQAAAGESVTIFASQTPPGAMPDPLASRFSDGRFTVVHNRAGDARPDMVR